MEILKKLTSARGVSGHESEAGAVFKDLLSAYTDDITVDNLGNITGKISSGIENAKKLLWNSDIPICEVAEKSGFGCQQYLNKVFKKETGMTPVSYRKAFQQNYTL